MAGDCRIVAISHDVADSTVRARPTGRSGNIAISGNATVWDSADGGADAGLEASHHGRL
jgi:hypothetical protein